MAVVSYFIVPEEKWLDRRGIARVIDATEGKVFPEEEKKGEVVGENEKDK